MDLLAWAITAWLHEQYPNIVSMENPFVSSQQLRMVDDFLVVSLSENLQSTQYFHGTSPEVGLKVLVMGLLPMKNRAPEGVYSYRSFEISNEGFYDQGCIIAFENRVAEKKMSDKSTRKLGRSPVPSGTLCRRDRSAFKRHGADGAEWIHSSSDIIVISMKLRMADLSAQLTSSPAVSAFLLATPRAMSWFKMGPWGNKAEEEQEKQNRWPVQKPWQKQWTNTSSSSKWEEKQETDLAKIANSMMAAQRATLATVLRMEKLVQEALAISITLVLGSKHDVICWTGSFMSLKLQSNV